jgi:hypothetical protein
MVLLITINEKTNDDRIKKGRFTANSSMGAEIVANIEFQFIGATQHSVIRQQRLVGAAIGIGRCIGNLLAVLATAIQSQCDTVCGTTPSRVENVRCQSSHIAPPSIN